MIDKNNIYSYLNDKGMQMHLTTADIITPIPLKQIIKSQRRSMCLEFTEDASLVLRVPYGSKAAEINQFIASKERWLKRTHDKLKAQMATVVLPRQFNAGEKLLYLGKEHEIFYCSFSQAKIKLDSKFVIRQDCQPLAQKIVTNWYRAQAKAILQQRVDYYANSNNFVYNQCKISSAKKRWGSCSSDKNLNFSWYLIMAPLHVIDYVVVHEIAHLKHMNHSKRFWNLVTKMLPEFNEGKQWLKHNGHRLTL